MFIRIYIFVCMFALIIFAGWANHQIKLDRAENCRLGRTTMLACNPEVE